MFVVDQENSRSASELSEDARLVASLSDAADWRVDQTISLTAKLTTVLSRRLRTPCTASTPRRWDSDRPTPSALSPSWRSSEISMLTPCPK
jgi:hypothetical protein